MPPVVFRCFHKAVAIIYKPRVTSLRCLLKLTKTYFTDSEKQGRPEGLCQAALEGGAGLVKSPVALLGAAPLPRTGQEAPLEMR